MDIYQAMKWSGKYPLLFTFIDVNKNVSVYTIVIQVNSQPQIVLFSVNAQKILAKKTQNPFSAAFIANQCLCKVIFTCDIYNNVINAELRLK